MQPGTSFRSIRAASKAKPVSISASNLIDIKPLFEDSRLPCLAESQTPGIDLVGWIGENRDLITSQLHECGGILFRDVGLDSATEFSQAAEAISPNLIDYHERAAPRTQVAKNVYTSTEFAADQSIPLHHEMSYSHNWPQRLLFYCEQPSDSGGRTPLTDDRKVFPCINRSIKERFCRDGVMYVRNFRPEFDRWQEVFQTENRSDVEDYCRRVNIEFEWLDGDRLRTRQVRQAVATHPETGDTVWFNHAHMFHHSNLPAEQREMLLELGGEDDLPRNAYYGDGSPIETTVLEEIRTIYREHAVAFTWQQGDMLLLDNVLASHGREPYSGTRRILVAMMDLFDNEARAGE